MKINLPDSISGKTDYDQTPEQESLEQKDASGEEQAKRVTKAAGAVATKAGMLVAKRLIGPKVIAVVGLVLAIVLLLSTLGGGAAQVATAVDQTSKYTEDACEGQGIGLADIFGLDIPSPDDLLRFFQVQTCQTGSGAPGLGYTGDVYPPTGGLLTSEFPASRTGGRGHGAIDIAGGCGRPVYAYAGGTVVRFEPGSESYGGPLGGGIVIEHTPSFYSLYWHMKASDMTVREGDIVSAGQQIGAQWSNGMSSGCHLHFEMSFQNPRLTEEFVFDPLPVLHADGFMYARGVDWKDFPEAPIPGGTGLPEGTGEPGNTSNGGGAATPAKEYARQQVKAMGWADREFSACLVPLWEKESNWRVDALNPRFSPRNPAVPERQAYGIPQAGPGSKMASAGADWKTNPQTQIRWGLGYIRDRYSTPCSAWAHSQAKNWY